MEHIHEHFAGRHDNERARGRAADHDEFGHLHQDTNVSSTHGEAAKYGSDYNQCAYDDNHDLIPKVLSTNTIVFLEKGADREDGFGVNLANAGFRNAKYLCDFTEAHIFKI